MENGNCITILNGCGVEMFALKTLLSITVVWIHITPFPAHIARTLKIKCTTGLPENIKGWCNNIAC